MKIERYVQYLPDIEKVPQIKRRAGNVQTYALGAQDAQEQEKTARRALFLMVRKLWTREQIKEAVAKGVAIEAERKGKKHD